MSDDENSLRKGLQDIIKGSNKDDKAKSTLKKPTSHKKEEMIHSTSTGKHIRTNMNLSNRDSIGKKREMPKKEREFQSQGRGNFNNREVKKNDINKHGTSIQKKSISPFALPSKLISGSGNGFWWECVEEINLKEEKKVNVSSSFIEEKRRMAGNILEYAVSEHEKNKSSHGDKDSKWMDTVVNRGTLSDKIGAMTLIIQQSPLHNLGRLEALVNMVSKIGKRESEMSMDPVKDLFINSLLPDRKLRDFKKIPAILSENATSQVLLVAEFEARLKSIFFKFVQAIEESSTKGLPHIKRLAMNSAFALLKSKPEQEDFLLSILVNKLGDPERKIAAKAAFLLSGLVDEHPAMKLVVVKEVEQLVFRANIADKAQYYAVIFLNQIMLNKGNTELASRLLQIYFTMFEKCTQKDNTVTTRLLSGLLTGVNRAYPFAGTLNLAEMTKQVDSLFRIVHIGSFSTAVQSLTLLFQVSESNEALQDRFYRALYSLLLAEHLQTASKHTILFNLIYRSIKADSDVSRCLALIKRVLQVCFHMEAPFICGSLYLVSQLLQDKPDLKKSVLVPEIDRSNIDNEEKPYDALAREPRAANATSSSLWELSLLATHVHPSVRKFAETILLNEEGGIQYKGDPLNDFTMISFLDRFAFRNPKKRDIEHAAANKGTARGTSKMQPYGFGKRGMNAIKNPVNSQEFIGMDPSAISADEMFYYHYFKRVEERGGNKKKKSSKDEPDAFDDEDEYATHLAEEMIAANDGQTGGKLDDEDVDFDWSDEEETKETEKTGDVEEESEDETNDNEEDDDDIPISFEENDSDEWEGLEDDDGEGDDDDDMFQESSNSKSKRTSVFADADDFAEILESAGVDDRIPENQKKWEKSLDLTGGSRKRRGGKHGSGGPSKKQKR